MGPIHPAIPRAVTQTHGATQNWASSQYTITSRCPTSHIAHAMPHLRQAGPHLVCGGQEGEQLGRTRLRLRLGRQGGQPQQDRGGRGQGWGMCMCSGGVGRGRLNCCCRACRCACCACRYLYRCRCRAVWLPLLRPWVRPIKCRVPLASNMAAACGRAVMGPWGGSRAGAGAAGPGDRPVTSDV